MKPLVSIICPVYNVERYLPRCLDSILTQILKDWECILIDDGSTDNSGVICDYYASHDSRFHVVHQQNGGVSSARQRGIDEAVGEYSIHVDPDDYIEPAMLKEMLQIIKEKNVDILVTDLFIDNKEKDTTILKQNTQDIHTNELIKLILNQKIHGSLCNKMIPLSYYKKYGISFPKGLNYCEDVIIWAQLAKYPLKVSYYPKAYYHYVSNAGSITHAYTAETHRQRLFFIDVLKECLDTSKYASCISRAEFEVFFEAWKHHHDNNYNVRNEILKYIKYVFSTSTGIRVKLACSLLLLRFDKLAHKLFLI